MKRHVNIPLFIPHMGCPNQCVFCNQHTISGACSFLRECVKREIEEALNTISTETHCEIAFFGGSFTGIDRELMVSLLDLAQKYVTAGRVEGIRMSTRPDYIDDEILSVLSGYTISAVELGIQSMDDRILAACQRGHNADSSREACAKLRKAGIPWVGQMMIGLPGSDSETEVACASQICAMGAYGSRIYPTVVLHGTTLADWTKENRYTPLTLEEAVERSCRVLEIFHDAGVSCLRIGLCDSENLHNPDTYMAGPVHPAMGELVGSRLYRHKMEKQIQQMLENRTETGVLSLEALVPRGDISTAVGQKRQNIQWLEKKYPVKFRKFIENQQQIRYNIQLSEH